MGKKQLELAPERGMEKALNDMRAPFSDHDYRQDTKVFLQSYYRSNEEEEVAEIVRREYRVGARTVNETTAWLSYECEYLRGKWKEKQERLKELQEDKQIAEGLLEKLAKQGWEQERAKPVKKFFRPQAYQTALKEWNAELKATNAMLGDLEWAIIGMRTNIQAIERALKRRKDVLNERIPIKSMTQK